jgi:hypothetical protein
MSDQDLQELVRRLRNHVAEATMRRVKFVTALSVEEALASADALERLSKARGTCSSCRFYEYTRFGVLGACRNRETAVRSVDPDRAMLWGCHHYESATTAEQAVR